MHRGKHLALSHINRVVPDLAARFIRCQFIRPNEVIAEIA